MPLTATHKAMGYKATQEDGKLIIHDVEIFCACTRWDFDFNDAWINKAVENAMEQQRGGYLPPLHIKHHDPAKDDVIGAGVFQITGARPFTFKGGRRTALFADLIITNPAVQEDILAERLPYRSVEMNDLSESKIDGLALLDHEAPFLELPLLMVAELEAEAQQEFQTADTVIPGQAPGTLVRMSQDGWRMERRFDDGPMVNSFRHGAGAHLLFRQEADMTKTEDKVELEPKPTQTTFAADGDDKEKKDDEGDKDMEADEGGGLDVKAVVKAIADKSISIGEMDEILAAIQAAQGEAAEEEAPAEEPAAAPAMAPGAAAMKKGTMDVRMAALQGKVEAMEAKDTERDAADTRRDDVAAALVRLHGRALGSDPEARFAAFHEKHGPEAFKAYIDEMAATFGVVLTEAGPTVFTANDPKAPECVLKFYKDGPDEGAKAAQFAANWQKLTDSGLHLGQTQKRYVDTNMQLAQA